MRWLNKIAKINNRVQLVQPRQALLPFITATAMQMIQKTVCINGIRYKVKSTFVVFDLVSSIGPWRKTKAQFTKLFMCVWAGECGCFVCKKCSYTFFFVCWFANYIFHFCLNEMNVDVFELDSLNIQIVYSFHLKRMMPNDQHMRLMTTISIPRATQMDLQNHLHQIQQPQITCQLILQRAHQQF